MHRMWIDSSRFRFSARDEASGGPDAGGSTAALVQA
jgi:hypothetical protein